MSIPNPPKSSGIVRLLFAGCSRAQATEHAFPIAMGALIGCLGGFGAVGFRLLISILQRTFWGAGEGSLAGLQSAAWYHVLLIPMIGGLVVGPLIWFLAREAKGHGVPEVMEAVALKSGHIRKRLVAVKSLASAVTIASGGSVGREGPIVHIGSAIGSALGQMLKVSAGRMRTFVGCGAAAGIAATFNAPIAGALFANEVILGRFGISEFSPIVVSSVVATIISRIFLGDYPAFIVPQYDLVSPWELLTYLGLGIAAGVVAVGFIRVLYYSEDLFDRLSIPDYLKPLIGGVFIGLTGIFLPHVFGVGYDTIEPSLHGQLGFMLLLLLLAVKILATSMTIGSGGSGGIFAPSLFMGAMLGGLVGYVCHGLFPSVTATPGAYSLVGMGSLVAGTTHAPLTAILIIFEMTSDYQIILPLMISCVISSLLARRLMRESIYTMKLIRRGVSLSSGRELNIMRSLKIDEVMNTEPETFDEHTPLEEMLGRMIGSEQSQFPVLDSEGKFTGMVSLADVKSVLFEESFVKRLFVAQDIATGDYPTVTASDNLHEAMKKFGAMHIDQIPVVSQYEPGKLEGLLWRKDVISAYNQEIMRRETVRELASDLARMADDSRTTTIAGYTMAEIPAPKQFLGWSIRDLGIRAKYHCEVISIKRQGSPEAGGEVVTEISMIPSPDTVISDDMSLVMIGPSQAINKLRKL